MKIAVHYPIAMPYSVKAYIDNIGFWLNTDEVQLNLISGNDSIPHNTDILWDPCCTGATLPYRKFRASSLPLIVTVHGASWSTLSWRECYGNLASAIYGKLSSLRRQLYWRAQPDCPVITVSNYACDEIQNALYLPRENIHAIYHGVDLETFKPGRITRDIFLHVSQCQPKKNIDRIIEAYETIEDTNKPPLVIVAPGIGFRLLPSSVQVVRETLTHRELADLYQRAMAFLFPSLHETFGLPILEAMACGAPVITSNSTACREVSSGHAILVNPRITSEIRDALVLLINNPELRNKLSLAGMQRANEFTWKKSAQMHLSLFRNVWKEKIQECASPTPTA